MKKMENAPSKVHSPFSIFNSQLLEDFFQRCNQLIHLLICADGNTQVIINARQLEIADKDTLFAQGGEDIRRFLSSGWVTNRKFVSDGSTVKPSARSASAERSRVVLTLRQVC